MPVSFELGNPEGQVLAVAFADECVRDARLAREAIPAARRKQIPARKKAS